MIWQQDQQIRRVFLNSRILPTPSFPGTASPSGTMRTATRWSWTHRAERQDLHRQLSHAHTTQLHVIERFQLIEGGKTIEVKVHVEDPGAYNMPWDAIQRYRRTKTAR